MPVGEDVGKLRHELGQVGRIAAVAPALEFGGDDAKSTPESLLIGALSSCHMLWFLALAGKKGFEVASYEDDADGVLDGKRFPEATLRPHVRWAGEPPAPEAMTFHGSIRPAAASAAAAISAVSPSMKVQMNTAQ